MAAVKVYKAKKEVPRGSFSIDWSMTSSLHSQTSIEAVGVDHWLGKFKFYSYDTNTLDHKEVEIGSIECFKLDLENYVSPANYFHVYDGILAIWLSSTPRCLTNTAISKRTLPTTWATPILVQEPNCTLTKWLSSQNFVA